MNAAPFANLEARLGAAVTARLANARLVPEGGVALPAVLSRPVGQLVAGQQVVQATSVMATVPSANLAEDFRTGSRCTVFRGDQGQIEEGEYLVRLRDDDPDAGLARLELETAPA